MQWRNNVSDFYSSSCVHLDTLTVGNRGTKSCRKDLNFQQYKEACNEWISNIHSDVKFLKDKYSIQAINIILKVFNVKF